jgi:hypothetical protein
MYGNVNRARKGKNAINTAHRNFIRKKERWDFNLSHGG